MKQSCPDFCDTGTLLHFANINIVHSGLDECEHVVQHGVVCCGKDIMCLKQFIKRTKRRGRPACDGTLVKDDEELVESILLDSNSQEIGLRAGSDGIKMLLDAGSGLRRKKTPLEFHCCNITK